MTKNSLTRKQAPAPTALERALHQLERVRSYEPTQLTRNEQTILALGAELDRLSRLLRRQPAALSQSDRDALARMD
jgi:hydrogenase maturation factor HypF (carbamoyltransferase family)